jgi:hypothetical protein
MGSLLIITETPSTVPADAGEKRRVALKVTKVNTFSLIFINSPLF